MNCSWCEEELIAGDLINTVSNGEQVFHRECMVRSIIGSVAHQEKRCSCYGGTDVDDPGLTRRQAAKVAFEAFRHRESA